MTAHHTPLPPAVNLHLTRACNARCTFCFATFREVRGALGAADWCRVIDRLADAGAEKINFAGGEPTLLPYLPTLIQHAKARDLTTSIVTNGHRLEHVFEEAAGALDWVGLSVDSADEATEVALGRSRGGHVALIRRLAAEAHALGIGLKLNTVVTTLSVHEDMSDLVRELAPERWKIFQMLSVRGQNDGAAHLAVSGAEFGAFVARHRAALLDTETVLVAEDNDAMTGSYAMVGPAGRFFDNTTGTLRYSRPILAHAGVSAFGDIGFDADTFEARGGVYAWQTGRRALPLAA